MTLWGVGDITAQGMEIYSTTNPQQFQVNRFGGVLAHGAIMGGVCNYYWYTFLDNFVVNTCKLSAGTARFVACKIGLEVAIWHPIGLLAYWCIVGYFEGHSPSNIERELKKDYFPTLVGDICLWTPMDIINFWKVPVQLQVLFINAGSLFEAIVLSYVHKHGFGSEVSDSSDKIGEPKSLVAERHHLPFIERILHLERSLTPEEILSNINLQFSTMDIDCNGYLTLDELHQGTEKGGLLPGVSDRAVNRKVAELLHRLADTNRDGKVSAEEYRRLILKFHSTGYRKSFIADCIMAIFDSDGNGFIDKSEMKRILKVYGCDSSDKAVADTIRLCDIDRDGRVSVDELKTVLHRLSKEL